MADSVVRLRLDSGEYDQKIRRAREGLLEMERECRKAGGTLEIVEKDQLEYVRSLGQMGTSARGLKGQINELSGAFTDLKAMYNGLTDAEKSAPFGRAMSESLEELKERIANARVEIGNINSETGGSGSMLNDLAGKFGLNIGQVTKFSGVLAAAGAAAKVAKDAFFASEGNIDEWGRTVESAKGAYDVFLQTLNNGQWQNFFTNLSTAISGARELYDALDRLGSTRSNNQAAIAIQQEAVQRLRLRKQELEHGGSRAETNAVNQQLRQAEERLAALQKQNVEAGKEAGRKQITEVLQNGTATRFSQAALDKVADDLLKNGQEAFDKYAKNLETLTRKGMETVTVPVAVDKDTGKVTYDERRQFNIKNLSRDERLQYEMAKAVTERETALQAGIASYAQAMQESTGSAREQFKTNQYILKGSGKGKTAKTETGQSLTDFRLLEEELKLVERSMSAYGHASDDWKTMNEYAEGLRDRIRELNGELPKTVTGLSGMNGETLSAFTQELQRELSKADFGSPIYNSIKANLVDSNNLAQLLEMAVANGIDTAQFESIWEKIFSGVDIDEEWDGIVEQINDKLREIGQEPITISVNTGELTTLAKEGEAAAKAWNSATNAIGSVGAALKMIDDPSVKVAGIIAEAIANIASTFAASLRGTFTPWDWIAGAATGTATMLSTVAAIKSVTAGTYDTGGIVPGNSFQRGSVLACVESGELILNKSQQDSVASQLQYNGREAGGEMQAHVRGEDILLAVNNTLRRQGRGEIVTSR